MKKTIMYFVLVMVFNFYCTGMAWSDEISELKQQMKAMQKQMEAMQKKIEILEAKKEVKEAPIKYTPGEGIEIEPAGLNIGAGATFIVQGTPNANNAGDDEDSIFDASWKANIEIEKEFDDWGLAFIELEVGENDAIEGELSLFSNVDRAASDTTAHVDLNKVWYEHYFFDKQLTITGGKIETSEYMDQNEYAYDEGTQFLCHIFRNSPAIEFPGDNGPGLHINICCKAIQFLEFDLGWFEGDANWDDIFDQAFYMAQVNLKPAEVFDIDPDQWAGNYRLYSWINDRFHTKYINKDETVFSDNKEMNYGFGISCDQMITDVFGIFSRYGWQKPDIIPAGVTAATPPGTATIEHSWSAGVQMTGKYWMREDDVLAFAIGQAFPSEEYDDSGGAGSAEGHIEAYYKWQLNECLAISPDIQFIWNPNGVGKSSEGDDDTIFVYGVRGQLDF